MSKSEEKSALEIAIENFAPQTEREHKFIEMIRNQSGSLDKVVSDSHKAIDRQEQEISASRSPESVRELARMKQEYKSILRESFELQNVRLLEMIEIVKGTQS